VSRQGPNACIPQTEQRRHFVSTPALIHHPLEQVLPKTADALGGGKDAVLMVDDTALPMLGKYSVGVKRQHCGVHGKQATC
jgi:SRSO17 transposase